MGRCGCDCGCACAAAQDKTNTDRATINLQSRLFFPHGIFIPGDQFIKISHRSEEHTSELQSRADMSYAGFCLRKKNSGGFGNMTCSWRHPLHPPATAHPA